MNSKIYKKKINLKNSSFAYIIIVIIILLLTTIHFRRFNIKHYQTRIEKEDLFNGLNKVYCDFNNDGNSEHFIFRIKNDSEFNLGIFSNSSELIEEYTYKGQLISSNNYENILVEDYNNNNQKELYFLWHKNDSVFIEVIEPLTNNLILSRFYIDQLNNPKSESDIVYILNFLSDIDSDNFKELYCTISAGLSLQPRNLYLIDINELTVKKSPTSFATPLSYEFYDFDKDGNKEIISGTYSSNNCPENYPYSDYYSWLMIFDQNLDFHNNPIHFKREIVSTRTLAINDGHNDHIIVLNDIRSTSHSKSKIILFNSKLEVELEKTLPESRNNCKHTIFPLPHKKQFLLFLSCGEKWVMDYNFNQIQKVRGFGENPLTTIGIVSSDKGKIYIFNEPNSNEYYFTDETFSKTSKINIPFLNTGYCNISVQENVDRQPLIFMQQGTDSFWIEYKKNKWYYFQLFIFHGFYILVIFVIWLAIKTIYNTKMKEIINEKQLIYFQFQSLKNQLSPHFTYNVLNSISNLILMNQNDKAYKLTISFSKLKRALLENSESNARTLEDEIDFVRQYLYIQEYRFGNRFKYTFKIDPNVNMKIPIPKLTLQTYVENSIKHGFKDFESEGEINIEISSKNNTDVVLIVRDNGVGRTAAALHNDSTGMGMKIMEKYYRLFRDHFGYKIKTKITDLHSDKGEPSGTEVIITVEKVD